MRIIQTPTPALFTRSKIYVLTVLWAVLAFAASITPAIIAIHELEKDFMLDAVDYTARLQKTMVAGEVALYGFKSLYAVTEHPDPIQVSRFVDNVLRLHDHIFSFELLEKVKASQLDAFKVRMQQSGFPNFQFKSFTFDSTRKWQHIPKKESYYPIVFIAPMTPEKRDVIGFDVDSVQNFSQTIKEATETGKNATSLPFKLIQGRGAYAVFSEVDNQPNLIADMIILIDKLPKADARLMGDGFNATLYHAHSETDAHSVVFHEHGKERSRIEKRLFQNLTYQHDFNDLNRPLKLVLSHQVGWSDLNLPMVSLNFFLAFVSIYILFSYLQSSRKRQLQMIEYQKQLIELAGHDHLTGLPNRHLLIDRLEQAFALSKRSGKYGALIFVDLNKFKLLNDTHGHLVGDLLLKSIASRLTDAVREIDTVARLGGDEFVVVANELSEDSAKAELAAHEIGSKLREMIEQPHQLGQLSYSSSASLGVSLFLGDQWTVDQVLAKADSEMYQEKRAGK